MTDTAPSHPFRSALGLISGVLLLVLVLAGLGAYRDLAAARERAATLSRRTAETELRIGELTRRIAALESDPATLERLARDELGMAKPGEVVLVLDRAAESR